MPPRRKPTSTRQKKADIQLKRAIKRGDIPPPDPKKNTKRKSHRVGPTGSVIGSAANPGNAAAVESSKKLQSAFIKLPAHFLETTKSLASTVGLPRPIPIEAAISADFAKDTADSALSCPRRPKWRFDMTKIEVEHNEEGLFKKWLLQTDELVEKWQSQDDATDIQESEGAAESLEPVIKIPRAPTHFERNLEVWRQLWRVTEISQIILILVDSRCPLLHYPPSLAMYLSGRKVILVLTKVDISGPIRSEAWTAYFRTHYPDLRVVQVESYIEKEASASKQGRKQYEPHLPERFRDRLVEAIREVHAEMLSPPDKVKSNPARLEDWKPPVKRDIDWNGVLNAGGPRVGSIVGGSAAPRPKECDASGEFREDQEPEFLTIGLIGQPNVGKSSLLNALFGMHKVRASKTPGKTKHFQTLFWTPDVRLVDCPGLVMPNFVPMEMQVLSGILPISRVSAVPACINHAGKLTPLERIYNLTHPALDAPVAEDKRTWREGTRPEGTEDKGKAPAWTAMDVLTACADAKGWVTAKAGRPDVHRAGNAILRQLAEGKIGWAFWPPGTDSESILVEGEQGTGIWIPRVDGLDEEESEEESNDDDDDSDEQEDVEKGASDDGGGLLEEEESDDDDVVGVAGAGRFGALVMEDPVDDGSEGSLDA